MFVPVITYDPDFFAPYTIVPMQVETAQKDSFTQTPSIPSAVQRSTVNSAATAYILLRGLTQITRQTVSANDSVRQTAGTPTQILTTFKTQKFASQLPAPKVFNSLAPDVVFDTNVDIEPLIDNVVYRVNIASLSLKTTPSDGKPVAPMVG